MSSSLPSTSLTTSTTNATSPSNHRRPTSFNDAQVKYIAEFYVEHYDVMRHDQELMTGSINLERNRLYRLLTDELNSKCNQHYTLEQIHKKVKNMKREAKGLLSEYDNGLRCLHGEDPDLPQMSESESLMVSKLLEARNQPQHQQQSPLAQISTTNHPSTNPNVDDSSTPLHGYLRVPSPELEQVEDNVVGGGVYNEDYMAAQSVQAELINHQQSAVGGQQVQEPVVQPILPRSQFSIPRLPHTVQPGGLRTLQPIKTQGSIGGAQRKRSMPVPSGMTNGQKRKLHADESSTSKSNGGGDAGMTTLKRTVLQLHKRVLQGELDVQKEKMATMAKFGEAIDEFRRYVAEQRMLARGVDVTNIPIDIPPGMQGIQGME